MPGFGYVDNPSFPRHRDAAFEIRDYITRGINSNRDVHDLNQRSYARYRALRGRLRARRLPPSHVRQRVDRDAVEGK